MVWMSFSHSNFRKGTLSVMTERKTESKHMIFSKHTITKPAPLDCPLPAPDAKRQPEVQDLDDFIFRWETQAPTVSDR